MKHASGTFEVKVTPTDASEVGKAGGIGRMTIEKVFSGALEGSSKGEMLTGGNHATGTLAYVAMETVTGRLEGRTGSFILRHDAWMMKSEPATAHLDVSVVASSGTGDLAGLTGRMTIERAEAMHSYVFEYALD